MLDMLFNSTVMASAMRLSIPLIFAAVGSCFCDRAGVFNIALECFMLCAAFFAALGTYFTVNPYFGVLCGIAAGLVCSVIFGLFVFHLKSSGIVVSIALNLSAWGLTTLLMISFWGMRGSFIHENLISLPTIHIAALEKTPYLGKIFSGQNLLFYLGLISIFVMWFVMYKTPFGLRLRGVGMNINAAQTIGINTRKYQWIATLITGAFCGIGGAVLPLGGTSIFSENMTAGRGFLAVAAVLVAKGNPLTAGLFCVLYAYTDAFSLTLQNYGIPSQLLETLPYVTTILVLVFAGLKQIFSGKSRSEGEKDKA